MHEKYWIDIHTEFALKKGHFGEGTCGVVGAWVRKPGEKKPIGYAWLGVTCFRPLVVTGTVRTNLRNHHALDAAVCELARCVRRNNDRIWSYKRPLDEYTINCE